MLVKHLKLFPLKVSVKQIQLLLLLTVFHCHWTTKRQNYDKHSYLKSKNKIKQMEMQRNTVVKLAVTETKSTILSQVITSLHFSMLHLSFCIFELCFWYRDIHILIYFAVLNIKSFLSVYLQETWYIRVQFSQDSSASSV